MFVAVLFTPLLLAACATPVGVGKEAAGAQGPLKVHPDLYYGRAPKTAATAPLRPTPAAQALPAPATQALPAPVDSAGAEADTATLQASKDLTAHLRSERSFYFALDQFALRRDYDPVIEAHASYLREHPTARVRIEGHADERGSREHNRRLGLKRAQSVRADLVARGAPGRQVLVKSHGELKPRLKGHDEASWAENRRADILYESE